MFDVDTAKPHTSVIHKSTIATQTNWGKQELTESRIAASDGRVLATMIKTVTESFNIMKEDFLMKRENVRLKRLVADLSLKKQVLKDVASGNL